MKPDFDLFFDSLRFSLSHEMRSPLRTISGFINLIIEKFGVELSTDLTQMISIIASAADEMNELIEALLNFLQITQHTINIQHVNVDAIITSEFKKQLSQFHDVQIEIIQSSLPVCQADHKLLTSVFSNLISNAFRFTKKCKSPRIEVGAAESNDETVIYFVKDNGMGFDMHYKQKLFKPFVKLHQDPDFSGVGLGLTIAKEIIDRHDGRIWAQAAPNEGATFYVQLKRASTDVLISPSF